MNWLDAVLLLILGVSVVSGFSKGLVRNAIGLVSLVASIVLAAWFYGSAGAWLVPYLNSRLVANFAGFLLIFIGVNVLGSLAGVVVSRLVKATGLSFFDHVFGAAFGAVKAVLIAIVLLLAIMAFSPGDKPPASVVHSRFAPYVVDASRVVAALTPYELRTGFRKTYTQVKRAWEEAVKMRLAPQEGRGKNHNEREI